MMKMTHLLLDDDETIFLAHRDEFHKYGDHKGELIETYVDFFNKERMFVFSISKSEMQQFIKEIQHVMEER